LRIRKLVAALGCVAAVAVATEARAEEAGTAVVETATRTDADRLRALEEKLDQQQRELDALKKARAADAAKPLDQTGAVKEAGAKPPAFTWGFKDGFFVKGEINGSEYEIRPRGRIQLDYRAFPHAGANAASPHATPESQFVMRRVRVGFGGRLGVFIFEADFDGARSPLPIADFWLGYAQFDQFQIRAGHIKGQFGADNLVSSRYLECVERPMIEGGGAMAPPNLRPGAMVLGKIGGGYLGYSLALQNQVDSNVVTSSEPTVTGRLTTDVGPATLGGAVLFSRWERGSSSLSHPGRTPGQHQFFTPVAICGWEQGYEVDASVYEGPFFMAGSYVFGQQERRRVLADGTDGTPLIIQGAYVTCGWMFAGPTTPGPHGIPFTDWQMFSLDLKKKKHARNIGAELIVRLEWIDIDDARGGRTFTNATRSTVATPSTAANAADVKGNAATAATVGLNLAPIENVRIMANYVHVHVADKTRAERAHSGHADEFLFRAQLEF
jgi:phosphate-selective porin